MSGTAGKNPAATDQPAHEVVMAALERCMTDLTAAVGNHDFAAAHDRKTAIGLFEHLLDAITPEDADHEIRKRRQAVRVRLGRLEDGLYDLTHPAAKDR